MNILAGFTECSLGNSEINSGFMIIGLAVHFVLMAVIFSDRKSEDNIPKKVKQARYHWRRQKGSVVGGILALAGIAMTHDGGVDYCDKNISWVPFAVLLVVYILIFCWSFFGAKHKKPRH